ncbi:hypothetical protein [Kushneria indalinina]|uniref:Uncharacterized protein n=1 Tax=Kushneria indalinina DSM 14324 TaxID=1122140 RepID=A0A3D9DX79_9GAMM|nr:hypothetical protein [Kushneria indalinina]REC94979.1 hypothetical protein C8D72_1811 [Kushneria indalinina DSM 14324]
MEKKDLYKLGFSDNKKFNFIMNGLEYWTESGLLKSKVGGAAKIFEDHYANFLWETSNGDFNKLKKLISFSGTKNTLFISYLSTFLYVKLKTNSAEELVCKGHKSKKSLIDLTDNYLISFECYKLLCEKKIPDIQDIKKIKEDLMSFRSQRNDFVLKEEIQRFLKWPTSEAPKSLQELREITWISNGVLDSFGYHVGEKGVELLKRRLILDKLVNADLESRGVQKKYVEQWGKPGTMGRLMKMGNTISSLCRNIKRRDGDFAKAIADWESDMEYLKIEYFDYTDKRINDRWRERKIVFVKELYGA